MKRLIVFAIVFVLGLGALLWSEKRKPEAPVSPAAFLYFVADTQRELTRLPVALTRLPDEEEIKIGAQLARRCDGFWQQGEEKAEQRAVRVYIERVGARVAARAHRKLPYKFHYIPELYFINAFALPGGHVFMGAGLMNLMDSEDQLAAVLGHEIEHIDHYHCAERVQLESALRKIPLGDLVALPIEVFAAGYSKDQELEADREGTRLAVWASYSPLGAIRMFETFDRLYQEHVARARTPQEELSQVALEILRGYFRSHPSPSERIEQIRGMITDEHWGNLTSERKLEVAYVFWTERATRALKARKLEAAARLAERSLDLQPMQPEALKILAASQFFMADFAAAAATYRKLLDAGATDHEAVRRFAESLAATRAYHKAAQEFRGWLDRSKTTGEVSDLAKADMAGLKLLAGDASLARTLYNPKTEPSAGGSPKVMGELGVWYYRAGKFDLAATLLDAAVEQLPGPVEYRVDLGWSLIEQGKLESAILRFSSAGIPGEVFPIVVTPARISQESHLTPGATMGRAVARWRAHQTEEALRDFASAADAEPYWLNLRWVNALYSPAVAHCVSEMRTEQQTRLAAKGSRLQVPR